MTNEGTLTSEPRLAFTTFHWTQCPIQLGDLHLGRRRDDPRIGHHPLVCFDGFQFLVQVTRDPVSRLIAVRFDPRLVACLTIW